MSRQRFRSFSFKESLEKLRDASLYRRRTVVESAQSVEVIVGGRCYLNFCSNDYLGLAADLEVQQSLIESAARFGVGSGASHMVCGHSEAHHMLEQQLADWVGRSRALLFSSGYMANVGVIQALLGRHDLIFQYRLNHASLIDGGRISGAALQRYRHGDMAHLQSLLDRVDGVENRRALAVTDSVFSMDGDVAPLVELAQLAESKNAWVMVDEAHALGVLGEEGAGATVAAGLSQMDVPIVMGTLGKAVGTAGAFVAGSDETIEYLIQHARTYIYTTALPPALCAATSTSVEIIRQENSRRERLLCNIRHFKQRASDIGLPLLPSETAIQPVVIGSAEQAQRCSERLKASGIWVAAIRPPTVPQGSARLRITLTAAHTTDMVDRLVDVLVCCMQCGDIEKLDEKRSLFSEQLV